MNNDAHWEQFLESLTVAKEFEAKLEELHADIQAERSFHKVYAAATLLVFLYGLMYGAWLCPK